MQKTQCELQVAGGPVLEAEHLALSLVNEARSYCNQLKGLEEHPELAHEKVTSIETAYAEAAV